MAENGHPGVKSNKRTPRQSQRSWGFEVATTANGAEGPLPQDLCDELQDVLGLTAYESRLFVATLKLGSANSRQLAQLSGVPRTSVYQDMETLTDKGLVERMPSNDPATWISVGREELMERVHTAEREREEAERRRFEERIAGIASRRTRVEEMLVASLPNADAPDQPYVQLLRSARKVKQAYDDLLRRAQRELVMFTRPPYASGQSHVDHAVLDMLARGVSARVLYQRGATDRRSFVEYHKAGVQARVVDHLPVKLVVVDRTTTLVSMTDPLVPEGGYPATLLIAHPGYAEYAIDGFERRWTAGKQYRPPDRRRTADDDLTA